MTRIPSTQDIPEAAFTAADEAYDVVCALCGVNDAVRAVVEAAAPHIAAAERERIRQLAIGRDATAWPDEGTQRIPFADLLTDPEGDTA